jgi:acetyl-CoA decarbonylase/synthase complex subunit beta
MTNRGEDMQHTDDKGDRQGTLHPGFEKLLRILPEKAGDFDGTEFGQPAAIAYLGKRVDTEILRKQAEELRTSSPEQMCETAMIMAEIIESSAPDHNKYFQTDAKTRDHVFNGSKWRSGWVFLMGNSNHSELAQKFRERDFLVFAQNVGTLKNAIDLGPRETAAVYFLQIMVRYAMIWGGIKHGDDHEMGHFLERDMPGVVVAHGKLTPVEELLLLGLMKMGATAVVPIDYPWDLGNSVRAGDTDRIIEAATKFPNLRIKEIQGKTIQLPAYCNPANITADFQTENSIGGGNSFFILMPADVKNGIELPENQDLSRCDAIGIMIEIGDKRLDVSTSEYIEKDALRGISTITGLRAEQTKDGGFFIHCAKGVKPDASIIAETLRRWIPYEFPYLENIHIKILTGDDIKEVRIAVDEFRALRQKVISEESDDNVKYFHYCLECQPFAKDHVCIITPDRPPMCGRDRLMQKAAALFGVSRHPWKRQELKEQEIRGTITVGNAIDVKNGEYVEVNRAIERLSPSHIKRVQLHGLREFPHTSCGCFQFLVFWIESLHGIGIMERDYQGEAPEGFTWDRLANAAGGKQAPGIVGVSRNYLRSKRFMQGEGGLDAVRWVSPKAFEVLRNLLPHPNDIQIGK